MINLNHIAKCLGVESSQIKMTDFFQKVNKSLLSPKSLAQIKEMEDKIASDYAYLSNKIVGYS